MRGAVLSLVLLAGPASPAQDESAPDFVKDVRPLLETYCFKCHSGAKPKGDLVLSAFGDEAAVFAKRKAWEEAVRRLRDGEMPPEDRPQPKPAEKERILSWFERAAERHDRNAPRDPGRAGLRRLNRSEYNNTIRDLLGVDLRPAEEFPADDTAHGYDTIADVLAIPPLLVEKYFLAAERILDQVLLPEPADRRFEGTREAEVEFPASGRYHLRARASGAGGKVAIRLEGKTLREFAVEKPQAYEVPVLVVRGKKKFSVTVEGEVRVEALEVAGPVSVPGAREARKRIFFAQPGADLPKREAARRVVERFASRAFRRPAQAAEVERFLALFDRAGDRPFEEALRLPLAAILCSPHFLFRLEEERASGGPWRIGGTELASRLSYFLWSTMPDDRLLGLAGEGKLHEPAVLEAEVRRMLADAKSKALVENFLFQWLQVDAFHFVNPDNRVFPEFEKDGRIRRGMQDELKDILLSRKDEFARFAAENMLVYALGRGVEGADAPSLREIVEGLRKGDYRFSALVLGIAKSYPFHFRRKGE